MYETDFFKNLYRTKFESKLNCIYWTSCILSILYLGIILISISESWGDTYNSIMLMLTSINTSVLFFAGWVRKWIKKI
jgi:hypothetical protein